MVSIFLRRIWETWLPTVNSAYAQNSVQVLMQQCNEVNRLIALWLPFGQIARHAEQFASQMSCLLLPKALLEYGLRGCPVSGSFVKLRGPSRGQFDAQPPISWPVSRSGHESTPKQGFKRPDESRSVHHHRLGQISHRQI
jgi:hypothetical protein